MAELIEDGRHGQRSECADDLPNLIACAFFLAVFTSIEMVEKLFGVQKQRFVKHNVFNVQASCACGHQDVVHGCASEQVDNQHK